MGIWVSYLDNYGSKMRGGIIFKNMLTIILKKNKMNVSFIKRIK